MNGCNIIESGEHAFYVYACTDPTTVINARGNWWGVADSTAIEDLIRHQADLSSAPLVDFAEFAESAFEIGNPVGILEPVESDVPSAFTLMQNYPNPFNLSTKIEFTLGVPGDVEVTIYDILGRNIRELASGYYPAGSHTIQFDGTDNRDIPLPSGMYFYVVRTGDFVESKKMILLK